MEDANSVRYSLDNPLLMEQYDNLAEWSKKCVDLWSDLNIQAVSKEHPDSQYVLAMCALMGKLDPMLSLHIGNIARFWADFINSQDEISLKLLKMTSVDRMTLILRGIVIADKEQVKLIQMLLYLVDLFVGNLVFKEHGFKINPLLEKSPLKDELKSAADKLKSFADNF